MLSCKQGQTSGNNIAKKMLWWNYFVIITKIITNIIVPRNYSVKISARMVDTPKQNTLPRPKYRPTVLLGQACLGALFWRTIDFHLKWV